MKNRTIREAVNKLPYRSIVNLLMRAIRTVAIKDLDKDRFFVTTVHLEVYNMI